MKVRPLIVKYLRIYKEFKQFEMRLKKCWFVNALDRNEKKIKSKDICPPGW